MQSNAPHLSDMDVEMETPEISEQEDDHAADSACKPQRRGNKSKKANSAQRRNRKRLAQQAFQNIERLERVGHRIIDPNRPLNTLTHEELIKLGEYHSIIPGKDKDKRAEVLCIDLDIWVEHWKKTYGITDTSNIFSENKIGVREEQLQEFGFKFLTHGTVYGFKKENEKDTLVFSVRFYPRLPQPDTLNPLTPAEQADLDKLAAWFHSLKENGKPISTNSAHKGVGQVGIMLACGWRPGSDSGFKMGVYAMQNVLDWAERERTEAEIARIFAHFFYMVSPNACDAAWEFLQTHDLPGLGTLKYGNPPQAPASSLYVSHSNFCNTVHRDRDCSEVAFGIWLTTRGFNKSIVDDADEVAQHIKGGQFFLPDYGIAIDFNHCGGIACVTWRAPQDRHATAYTETVDSPMQYMRWGSSIQVTKGIFDRTKSIKTMGGDIRDGEAYAAGRKGSGVGIVPSRGRKLNKKKAGKDKKVIETDVV